MRQAFGTKWWSGIAKALVTAWILWVTKTLAGLSTDIAVLKSHLCQDKAQYPALLPPTRTEAPLEFAFPLFSFPEASAAQEKRSYGKDH
jgi:hypothetical protein